MTLSSPLEAGRAPLDAAGPRRSRTWVLALALAIALLVALLYVVFLTSPGPSGGGTAAPSISLRPHTINTTVEVDVSTSSPERPLAEFNATLVIGGVQVAAIPSLLDGAANGSLSFSDRDGDDNLSVGDRFRSSEFTDEASELRLRWGGAVVASRSWTLEKPAVNLDSWSLQGGHIDVDVLAVALSYPLQAFGATLSIDGTEVGNLAPLADGATDGDLRFVDVNADGTLDAGDTFRITTIANGSYVLTVYWGDRFVAAQGWTI